MDERLREELRQHIAVALAVAPKHLRRVLWDYTSPGQQKAQRAIYRAIADSVMQAFEVMPRGNRAGPSLHTHLSAGGQ